MHGSNGVRFKIRFQGRTRMNDFHPFLWPTQLKVSTSGKPAGLVENSNLT